MKLFTCSRATGNAAGQLRGLGLGLPHYASQPLYIHRRTFTSTPTVQEARRDHDSQSLSNQVRLLMRRVPYPVAIITATDPHSSSSTTKSNTADYARGMTISSFSTVTLHPEPIISFNARRPSETLTALLSSRRFLVHLLAPGPATAALARDFSRGNRNHDLSVISGEGAEFEYVAIPAASASASASETGVSGEGSGSGSGSGGDNGGDILPLLRRKTPKHLQDATQDTPFIFECVLHPQQMEVYDHTIVLGRVVRTIVPQQQQSGDGDVDTHGSGSGDGSSLCLTYADTRFWGMGREIKDS